MWEMGHGTESIMFPFVKFTQHKANVCIIKDFNAKSRNNSFNIRELLGEIFLQYFCNFGHSHPVS